MDNFYNFYDNNNNDNQNEPKIPPEQHTETYAKLKRSNTALIIISVLLAVVVIVNIVVLASMQNIIAEKYGNAISSAIRDEYLKAIEDKLSDSDIVSDVIDSASNSAAAKIDTSIGEYVADNCMSACAVITCTSATTSSTATGFLITNGSVRYMLTNHHVVTYEKETRTGMFTTTTTVQYPSIACKFYGESTTYQLEIVYLDEDYDLALLTFKTATPSYETHPAVKLASSDYAKLGEQVAIIGNPKGIGLSVTTGTISHTAMKLSNWGDAYYIMTDAAVNNGNSGGPMFDKNGIVIGIIESKISETEAENMGFAVAMQTVLQFLKDAEDEKSITIDYVSQGRV